MNGPVFDAIFIIGLAASVATLTLIGLTLVLCARDSWRSRRQTVAMERLRVVGDREWSDEELVVDVLEKWFASPCAPDPRRLV